MDKKVWLIKKIHQIIITEESLFKDTHTVKMNLTKIISPRQPKLLIFLFIIPLSLVKYQIISHIYHFV